MNNYALLCCLGSLLVIGLFALPLLRRLLGGFGGGSPYTGGGQGIGPTYDDPNIESRGAFGRAAGGVRPQYDNPNIRSRGFFGRSRGSGVSRSSVTPPRVMPAPPNRSADSPNIRSRGSFGRSKRR